MKYLLLDTYPGVAIPIDALALCQKLRLVKKDYDSGKGWSYMEAGNRRLEGTIIDDSEIQPYVEKPDADANQS